MERPLKVLVVEADREDCARSLEELRKAAFRPTHRRVLTAEEFVSALDGDEWDLILSDYSLPEFGVLDALRILDGRVEKIPLIVVTGKNDEEIAVECLKNGAEDYVLKDNIQRLGRSTGIALEVFENRRSRHRLEQELRHAQKLEAVGTLAAGVAHDLNNLLMAIFGYTEMARTMAVEPGPLRTALDGVMEAARQASGVTRSLLTFSRRAKVERSPFDLGKLVRDTSRLVRRMLPATIEVELFLPERSWWVEGDPIQIQQVLINLAINARDAMARGGHLRLAVETRWESEVEGEGREMAALTLADDGIGMPQEVLDNVFDPFFTTKPRALGTGLGMAVAHGIVRDHGGWIELTSETNQGTQVIVLLPTCAEPETDGPDVENPGEQTILLAEDNLQVRSLMASALESRGFRVLQAVDGERALAAYEESQEPVTLAILDVDLPKQDGLSCLRRLVQSRPDLPAIMISGLPNPPVEQVGERVRFLPKPFQARDLLAHVNALLTHE